MRKLESKPKLAAATAALSNPADSSDYEDSVLASIMAALGTTKCGLIKETINNHETEALIDRGSDASIIALGCILEHGLNYSSGKNPKNIHLADTLDMPISSKRRWKGKRKSSKKAKVPGAQCFVTNTHKKPRLVIDYSGTVYRFTPLDSFIPSARMPNARDVLSCCPFYCRILALPQLLCLGVCSECLPIAFRCSRRQV